jgi:hypothetical protein
MHCTGERARVSVNAKAGSLQRYIDRSSAASVILYRRASITFPSACTVSATTVAHPTRQALPLSEMHLRRDRLRTAEEPFVGARRNGHRH